MISKYMTNSSCKRIARSATHAAARTERRIYSLEMLFQTKKLTISLHHSKYNSILIVSCAYLMKSEV